MDAEKVITDLNRRFAEPLPEFYKRRIIFWRDDEREFEDKLDEITLANAKLIRLTGTNNFEVKKLLTVDDTVSNFLVYNPFSYSDNLEKDWLLNVELYSEEFYADLNSIWIDEMGLPASTVLRGSIKQYHKFFNSKERRAKVAAINKNITTAPQLHLAVMSVICGEKDANANAIIRAVLMAGLDNDSNAIYKNMVSFNATKAFWLLVGQATGYHNDEPSLSDLASRIMLTALSRTIREDKFSALSDFVSVPHQAFCYDFISDWLHSTSNDALYELARKIEEKHQMYRRLSLLTVEDLAKTESFPCVDECILYKLMAEIKDDFIRTDVIRKVVIARRTTVWYDHVKDYYEAIYQVAEMQDFYVKHSTGFHIATAKEIWDLYTKEYYKMDSCYRQFNLYYMNSLRTSNPILDDMIKTVADKMESLYSTWYLGELGSNWSDICAEELEKYGWIQGVSKQTDFYASRIKKADSRVYVIISDAMRYAVGVSLAEQLRIETQCKVDVTSIQAVFPSITKFGMAALLPHKQLSVIEKNGALSVLADEESTDAPNRDKILKKENIQSVALKYRDIIEMKRAERQELVKGMDVVYIYHDKIDETAHTSEKLVFNACDEAISEIKNMIRIICNEFGGARVLVTSDHGFLYTAKPLAETDKVSKADFNGKDVEYARRYAILQKGTTPEYLMPVKFLDGTQYDGFAPRENIRIKMNGGGMNFVHGGISLQELVVPVVDYRFLRNDYSEYQRNRDKFDTKPVEIGILSASRKICNMIFSLSFYQKEVVGGVKVPATYLLQFTDENGVPVSDTAKIIADRTGSSEQDRTFRCTFNLKAINYNNRAKYYLVIKDEAGLQAPQKEEFQIDIAFSVGEFSFFNDDDKK